MDQKNLKLCREIIRWAVVITAAGGGKIRFRPPVDSKEYRQYLMEIGYVEDRSYKTVYYDTI